MQQLPQSTQANFVDLRSDTVTQPTAAMYEKMRSAPIGDDGLDGDPTARKLESTTAEIVGKEAGLFVPSCTMANLIATLAQAQRYEQVVLEASSHMFTSERGSNTLTGLSYVTVAGANGAMDLKLLEEMLLYDRSNLKYGLVCMETSHNNASGAVLPLEHMRAVYELSHINGINVHLDGARMFNAAVALGVSPAKIGENADTISLCLSKGLSAPVGAVLVGRRETIKKAKFFRKILGGTQRQVGIMAAAGLEAVQQMVPRLAEDHARAQQLSRGVNGVAALGATIPQTNIVQIDVSRTGHDSAQWSAELEASGILARPWGRHRLRCVTHRHIVDEDIDRAVGAFQDIAKKVPIRQALT
jgi:threonine aldolase